MKVAIVSANIGKFDEVYGPGKQTEPYDLHYYTENTLPFPLPNIDNRMKGKYLKIQTHRFLDHDIFIWIDGSVEVIDGTFVAWVLEQLRGNDVIASLHPDRGNIYSEIEHIIGQMKKGSKYLLKRYAQQPFEQEYNFYRSENMPDDYPLYGCYFFARRNTPKVNKAFEAWWDYVLRYTNFDQTQFSYACWKFGLKVKAVDPVNHINRRAHRPSIVGRLKMLL